MDFSVGIGDSCYYCYVLFIVDKIFFPYFNRFCKLPQSLVAVGKPEERVIVVRMKFQASAVKFYCFLKIFLLPFCVAKSYKSVVVVCVKLKNFFKKFSGFIQAVRL